MPLDHNSPAAALTEGRGEKRSFGDSAENTRNGSPRQWQTRVEAETQARANGRFTFVVKHDGKVIAWSATGAPKVVVLLESGRVFIDDDDAMLVVLALARRRSADKAEAGGVP